MLAKLDLGANGSDPSCVGIDDSTSDCDAGNEAKFVCRFLAEGAAELTGAEVFTILSC